MPVRSKDLHGSAPDKSGAALLLIDVINHFRFSQEGDQLLRLAQPVGENIRGPSSGKKRGHSVRSNCKRNSAAGCSDFKKIVEHACADEG